MLEVSGKYGTAKIFTDMVETKAYNQVKEIMNHDVSKDTVVRLMPDIHFGKGATVGTSIRLPDDRNDWRVSPNVVGVDIGCGMMSYKLETAKQLTYEDFKALDETIKNFVPSGFHVHNRLDRDSRDFVKSILDPLYLDLGGKQHHRIQHSLGTLGGGNHFIELSIDESLNYWLTVHSGSRNLGVQVASFYQNIADENSDPEDVKYGLGYLTGELLNEYLNDMQVAQGFAYHNRKAMLDNIISNWPIEVTVVDSFDSIHNYIDIEARIIRKGATSANVGERLIVPLNMKEGSLICEGIGNKDWNYSAPHGAGRQMSRTEAKKEIPLRMFKREMEGIYSSSVKKKTLDEAPAAYKPSKNVIENSTDTMKVIHELTPVFNFKA